jgi:hypothetical protein
MRIIDLLELLDGAGLVITDYDELENALKDQNWTLNNVLDVLPPEDDFEEWES